MDFRKIFDSNVSPDEFDKLRTRYCDKCFADMTEYAQIDSDKSVLEIGPGTGQATEPILKTGCSYLAIELGENFTTYMKKRYGLYSNFQIVNADFETFDFMEKQFDLIYSAATIQWIPEEIAFSKTFNLLKNNGTLAMMTTYTDYRIHNENLYQEIQKVYDEYFRPETPYTQHLEYQNAVNYGFVGFERREYHNVREYNADEFIAWKSIMAPHLTLPEPFKSKFFEGIRNAVLKHGNNIILRDTIILYLTRKL